MLSTLRESALDISVERKKRGKEAPAWLNLNGDQKVLAGSIPLTGPGDFFPTQLWRITQNVGVEPRRPPWWCLCSGLEQKGGEEAKERGRPSDGDGLLARVRSVGVGREESECEREEANNKEEGRVRGRAPLNVEEDPPKSNKILWPTSWKNLMNFGT